MRPCITLRVVWASLLACLIGGSFQPSVGSSSAGLEALPQEIRETFREILMPKVTTSQVIDLDLDGTREVVIVSHSPVAATGVGESPKEIFFQTLLMVFQEMEDSGAGFPYETATVKSVRGAFPRPAHLSIRDLGGGAEPELVWFEEGPDMEGKYSSAAVYRFEPDSNDPLGEEARFSSPEGWLRIYDLDEDGAAELVSFVYRDGQPWCIDLMFFHSGGFKTLQAELAARGIENVASLQATSGLDPNGKVTKDVLTALKALPPLDPPAEESPDLGHSASDLQP